MLTESRDFRRGRRVGVSLTERFWSKVDIRGPDECWPWLAYRNDSGYGKFDGRRAHRVAYALTQGLEPSQHVLHTCDNPPCCNPAHLYEGTPLVNARDRESRGRGNQRPPAGEAHHASKITDSEARAIRCSAEGAIALARRYGVARQTIYRIRNGKRKSKERETI